MPISEAATRKRLDRARTKGLLDGVPQGKEVVWAAKVKERDVGHFLQSVGFLRLQFPTECT
jgi:hypothetical protein